MRRTPTPHPKVIPTPFCPPLFFHRVLQHCTTCGSSNHNTSQCKGKPCAFCLEWGHYLHVCPNAWKCDNCNLTTHITNECPQACAVCGGDHFKTQCPEMNSFSVRHTQQTHETHFTPPNTTIPVEGQLSAAPGMYPLYYKSCVRCRRLEQRREALTEREAREVILRGIDAQ